MEGEEAREEDGVLGAFRPACVIAEGETKEEGVELGKGREGRRERGREGRSEEWEKHHELDGELLRENKPTPSRPPSLPPARPPSRLPSLPRPPGSHLAAAPRIALSWGPRHTNSAGGGRGREGGSTEREGGRERGKEVSVKEGGEKKK